MKKISLIGSIGLLALQAKAFNPVKADTLKVDCSGTMKLEKLVKASYNPGLPPQGRFPGTDPSESIVFKASFQKLSGTQCSLLETKYKQDLKKQIHVHVSPQEVVGQAHVEAVAQSLLGSEASFQIKQSFGFQSKSGYLPLFPKIVEESMSFSGTANKTGDFVGGSFDIDTASIYGTTPMKEWSDEEKLILAKQLKWSMGKLGELGDLQDFHNLFLNIEVQSVAAQKEIFYILWNKFNEATLSPYTHFFDFEVGGTGAFVGHPFAKKLIGVANAVATATEKEQLIFQFPNLLKPGGFSEKYCMNLQPENLTNVIKQWQAQAPIMLNQQFYDAKEMLNVMASGQKPNLLNDVCITSLNTEANTALASEALKSFQN